MASGAEVLLALCVPAAVPFAVGVLQRRLRRAVYGKAEGGRRRPGKKSAGGRS